MTPADAKQAHATQPAGPLAGVDEVGTYPWVERTGGQLTAVERRHLARPLAASLASSLTGRLAMLLRLNTGRRHDPHVRRRGGVRAARRGPRDRLSTALLNHSHRTFLLGAALGELEGLDVDREVLYAAALLHDVGLPSRVPSVDFTHASACVAGQVAEQVGLSTAATDTLRNAITLHYNPGVSLAHGPVAYLLSAGAAADVVGLRTWQLPPALLSDVVTAHPRAGFKREFAAAFRAEAGQVPQGRAAYLRRYGGFGLAIRTAPFHG
jgi:hypothetical protein